jgi:thioredoxin-like negative regulator of GroEL
MNSFKLISETPEPPVQTLTRSTFDQFVLKGDGPISVEFMSYSCEHCRAMEPIIEQVAVMMKSKAKIYKVNIVSDPELGNRFDVQATPTLATFLNGKIVGWAVGPKPSVSSILTAIAHPFRSFK